MVGRARGGRAGRRRRGAVAPRQPARALRRRHRRLSRATSTCPPPSGSPRPARALQSARLAPREPRRGPRPLRAGSPGAGVLRQIDRIALRRADLVVADTEQNARHLAELGELPDERLAVCFVGAEERLFRPGWQPAEDFHALFVGKLIPLHGLETILAAARLAPEIPFRVVGSGQLDALLLERPPNVEWIDWVDYERLPEENQRAGCALGVFGTSAKAARVIPNKAFQALACGTPLVTGDTPAARELLRDGDSALLVPPGDPEALAAAVRRLAGDRSLRERRRGRARGLPRPGERGRARRTWLGLVEQLVAR